MSAFHPTRNRQLRFYIPNLTVPTLAEAETQLVVSESFKGNVLAQDDPDQNVEGILIQDTPEQDPKLRNNDGCFRYNLRRIVVFGLIALVFYVIGMAILRPPSSDPNTDAIAYAFGGTGGVVFVAQPRRPSWARPAPPLRTKSHPRRCACA